MQQVKCSYDFVCEKTRPYLLNKYLNTNSVAATHSIELYFQIAFDETKKIFSRNNANQSCLQQLIKACIQQWTEEKKKETVQHRVKKTAKATKEKQRRKPNKIHTRLQYISLCM